MIADSYLGSETSLDFSNDKQVLFNLMTRFWKSFSTKEVNYSRRGNSKGSAIRVHDVKAVKELHDKYSINYGVAKNKEVPNCIMNSPRDIQLAFLSGYLECESSISGKDLEVTSASYKLLKEVQLMLMNIGIVTTLREKSKKLY